jgi:hypothetical protein
MEATLVNTEVNTNVANAANAAQAMDIASFEQQTGAQVTVSNSAVNAASTADDFSKLIGAAAVTNLTSDVMDLAAEYRLLKNNEQIAIATTKKSLYGILGRCYGKYLQITQQSEKEQKRLELQLDEYMLVNNIDTTGKTMLLSKLLMCVFVGADAKKINSYCAVLAYAQKHSWKAENLVQHITDNGGLQAIRLAGAADKKTKGAKAAVLTREQKLTNAVVAVNKTKLDVFTSDALAREVQATTHDKLVLIVTQLEGGQYAINAAVANDSVVNAALLAYYSTNKVQIVNEQETQSLADEQQAQLAQMQAAVATAH